MIGILKSEQTVYELFSKDRETPVVSAIDCLLS